MKYPDDYIDKIICGDCLEVMKGIPDECIDLTWTDPPYNVGKDYGIYKDNQEDEDNLRWIKNIIRNYRKPRKAIRIRWILYFFFIGLY